MDVTYCEVCEKRREQEKKLTCGGADDAHRDVNILECGRIVPEWCPKYKNS